MSSFSLLRYYFYHRKYVFSVAIATNTKKVGIPGGYIIGNFLKNAGMSADTIPYSLMEKESIIEIIHN